MDRLLDQLEMSIKEEATTSLLTAAQKRAKSEYAEQMAFVKAKAGELSFVARCLGEVASEVATLKGAWLKSDKEKKSLFVADEYKSLHGQKVAMEKDQVSLESELQRYFDNAT